MIDWNSLYNEDNARYQNTVSSLPRLSDSEIEDIKGDPQAIAERMLQRGGADRRINPEFYNRILNEVVPLADAFQKLVAIGYYDTAPGNFSNWLGGWLNNDTWTGGVGEADARQYFNNFLNKFNAWQANPLNVPAEDRGWFAGMGIAPKAYENLHLAMLKRLYSPESAAIMARGIGPVYDTSLKDTSWGELLQNTYKGSPFSRQSSGTGVPNWNSPNLSLSLNGSPSNASGQGIANLSAGGNQQYGPPIPSSPYGEGLNNISRDLGSAATNMTNWAAPVANKLLDWLGLTSPVENNKQNNYSSAFTANPESMFGYSSNPSLNPPYGRPKNISFRPGTAEDMSGYDLMFSPRGYVLGQTGFYNPTLEDQKKYQLLNDLLSQK